MTTACRSYPMWASFWEHALLGHVVQPCLASATVTADTSSRQGTSHHIPELQFVEQQKQECAEQSAITNLLHTQTISHCRILLRIRATHACMHMDIYGTIDYIERIDLEQIRSRINTNWLQDVTALQAFNNCIQNCKNWALYTVD